MKLSKVPFAVGLQIRRDGMFESLGLLSHTLANLLVVYYDRNYLANLLANDNISCVITNEELAVDLPEHLGIAVADDPVAAFYHLHNELLDGTEFYGATFATTLAEQVVVHPTAYVAPQNVRIGRGSIIGPRAVVLERTTIGEDVVVGPGAVIGGEGFEPKYVDGRHIIIRHGGGVRLHDRVEIQANSHVAKSVFNGDTEIGEGTKIDALVHVAHNVRIGKNCEIAASAMIAGSTTIGDQVWIGPTAIISSEVTIENRAFVGIGSLVLRDVAEGARVFGFPARVKPIQD